jgi:DNA-binding transcriptional ArsR family regulator
MNTVMVSDPFTLQASYFKALAHPVRLQILAILRQGEACVCHLEAILQKRQAYISQQLMALREAGLLAERKEGLFVFYRLADPDLATILDSSLAFVQLHTGDAMLMSVELVSANGRCSCPTCSTEIVKNEYHHDTA